MVEKLLIYHRYIQLCSNVTLATIYLTPAARCPSSPSSPTARDQEVILGAHPLRQRTPRQGDAAARHEVANWTVSSLLYTRYTVDSWYLSMND